MRRIALHLRAVEPRQAALFLAVAALVAAAAYFGAREAGVGGSTAASGEGGTPEPLTLTLTAASQICETEQAIEYGAARQWEDEDGNWQIERYSDGWDNVSETPVTLGGVRRDASLHADDRWGDAGREAKLRRSKRDRLGQLRAGVWRDVHSRQ